MYLPLDVKLRDDHNAADSVRIGKISKVFCTLHDLS